MKAFYDTHIFVYSVSVAAEDAPKRRVAQVSFEGPEALVAPWVLSERHYKTVRFSRSVSSA